MGEVLDGVDLEARVISAHGSETSGLTQAPLKAIKAVRGFVLPTSIDDMIKEGLLQGIDHMTSRLVKRLRDTFPDLLLVMQNATGPVTREGRAGGLAFPLLLDNRGDALALADAALERVGLSERAKHRLGGGDAAVGGFLEEG